LPQDEDSGNVDPAVGTIRYISAAGHGHESLNGLNRANRRDKRKATDSNVPDGSDTVGADRSQRDGNCEQIIKVYPQADSELYINSASLQSYHGVPLLEPSGMKYLAEQVWLLMKDYATTSCTNMDKVWDIIKRNVEERVGPISPVCELIVKFPLEINSDVEPGFQHLKIKLMNATNECTCPLRGRN
jgi:hypothetical protein